MSKYQERLRRIAKEEVSRVEDLFQTAEAETPDLSDLSSELASIMNLLKDVKTEVNHIEKNLGKPKPEEEEDDDGEEDSKDSTPEDRNRRLKLLEDLGRRLLELNDPSLKMLPDGTNLPSPLQPKMRNTPEGNILRLLLGLLDFLDDAKTKLYNWLSTQYGKKQLTDILSAIQSMSRETSMMDRILADTRDELASCCESTHEQLDRIERTIGGLEPSRQAGMELAILRNSKFIIADLDNLRRLL